MQIINPEVRMRFRSGSLCEFCQCRTRHGADPHHVFCRGMGGGSTIDHPWNLISLCRTCHTEYHAGVLPRSKLIAIVAKREGIRPSEVVTFIYAVRRASTWIDVLKTRFSKLPPPPTDLN